MASATTLDDIIKLKANKVSDDVLIALIESDGSVFYLSADDILKLREKGLSDKVIVAMLTTGTKARLAGEAAVAKAAAQKQAEQEAQYERYNRAPGVESPAPQPPVSVTQTVTQTVEAPQQMPYPNYYPYYTYPSILPINYPYNIGVNRPVVSQTPVYWGYGGQRRPDSWALSTEEIRRAQAAGQTAVVVKR